MIKSLENPHFKSILEEVNWKGRHPKAKSLEEAFVWESNINEALVATGDGKIYRCKDVEFCESNPYSVGINPKNNIKIKNEYNYEGGYQCIILGRPITLEDILILLSKKAYSISIPCFASYIIVTILSRSIVTEYFISWQLGRYLHEQNEDTWIELSKLIKTQQHVLTVEELPSQTHGIN